MKLRIPVAFGLSCALASAVTACRQDDAKPAAAQRAPAGPIEVGVVTIQPAPLTLIKELPGRTSALRVAEVRARVNGIVLKRLFTEGADVKEGQPLFQIDPAPYQAALDAAGAQVVRAEAMLAAGKLLGERYEDLIKANAISRQEYDDALVRVKTAQADLAAARAAQQTARLNVGYTRVTAPITGRIGRAEVTEGAYVQSGSATLLATVQQLDKLYVDMTWSSAEVMRMRRAIADGKLHVTNGEAQVTVILEDGAVYEPEGALQFADVSVDQTTGSILLRAIVPNPRSELFPGMFVKARINEGSKPDALLVPQRAVTRDQNGRPVALVVDKDSKVERRALVTDRAVGDAWLVTSGIAPGDRVIIEGIQQVRPGAAVAPVPYVPKPAPVATGSGSLPGAGSAGAGSAGAGSGSAGSASAGSAAATGAAAAASAPRSAPAAGGK